MNTTSFEGYYISYDDVASTISKLEISEDAKQYFTNFAREASFDNKIDSLKIGMKIIELAIQDTPIFTKDELDIFICSIKNLDNVPFVNIKGKTVH